MLPRHLKSGLGRAGLLAQFLELALLATAALSPAFTATRAAAFSTGSLPLQAFYIPASLNLRLPPRRRLKACDRLILFHVRLSLVWTTRQSHL
jgi:hypothetical protein